MGKFKRACKPQETYIWWYTACPSTHGSLFLNAASRAIPAALYIFLQHFLDGRSVKMLVSYGSKESKFRDWTDQTDSNHLTHANAFLLFVFGCQFSVCIYTCVCVCVHTCVPVLSPINLCPGQACSCSFCLLAIDNTEPSKDCSFPPSLTIPLLCIHKTISRGKFYINKYLSSY